MHRGLNTILIIAIIALTLGATYLMDGHNGVMTGGNVKAPITADKQQPAPDIILTDLSGKQVRLHDYKGKIVLLNFWATWCTPCIAEFPQFVNLAKAMPDGLVILAVSIDDDPAVIPKFMKRYVAGYESAKNLKLFSDRDMKISQDMFQTVRVPETIIITPKMMMARKVAGLSIAWDSDETKNYLAGLMAD